MEMANFTYMEIESPSYMKNDKNDIKPLHTDLNKERLFKNPQK